MRIDADIRTSGLGSRLGYMSFAKNLFNALKRNGIEFDTAGDVRMDIAPPFNYYKWRLKYNVFFTMWESDSVPDEWKDRLSLPDLMVVPCVHNQELFKTVTNKPVEVCHLGVDENYFQYHEREKSEPFVFLYVGDSNARKGLCHIVDSWNMWNDEYPEFAEKSILLLKVTEADKEQKEEQIAENIFRDSRVLPFHPNESGLPTLRQLYYSANAFIFPTTGEGFGLTLAEAMATGLPCIYTPWSGPADFISEAEGYPVDYGFRPFDIMRHDGVKVARSRYANPYKESIVEQMVNVFTDYDAALKKGRLASEKIRTYFTWDKTAKRLIRLIERHKGGVWM